MLSALLYGALALSTGLYFWLSHQIGASSIHATVNLILKGRVTFKRLKLAEWSVEGFSVSDFADRPIYTAARIQITSASFSAVTLEVQCPYINLLADDEGLLYAVALLQEVGYLKEKRASISLKQVHHAGASNLAADEDHHQPARVALTGQLSASFLRFVLKDGTMEVPHDFGKVIGNKMDFKIAAGSQNVQTMSQLLHSDVPEPEQGSLDVGSPKEWWREENSIELASREGQHNSGGAEGSASSSGTDELRRRYPILLHFCSDNILSGMKAWRTKRGLLLSEPIVSKIHFTEEIAKFALSRLHPLLGHAASLESGDYIQSRLTPLDMHLPCDMYSLRLQPLKVRLKTKKFVKGLIKFLKVLNKKEWDEADTLEAWTSAIAADIHRSGLISSQRMDVLLGHDVQHGDGLHMVMWGIVDYAKEAAIEMFMGLSSQTLTLLGCRELDKDFTYIIPVKGTARAPEIDWLKSSRHILEMIAKSKLQKNLPFFKKVFRNPSEKRRSKQDTDVPPPTLPFPWQAFDDAPAPSQLEDSGREADQEGVDLHQMPSPSSLLKSIVTPEDKAPGSLEHIFTTAFQQGFQFPEQPPIWRTDAEAEQLREEDPVVLL